MDDREASGIGEISDEEEKIDDEETQGEEKGGVRRVCSDDGCG